jgi:SAM-dependent methyltransferase
MTRYIHDEAVHNLRAPRVIVPVLVSLFAPKSVVDVGCGIGTFLSAFKEAGVGDVVGVDGAWVDERLRNKYLEESQFLKQDLEKRLSLGRRFDLALCLEVAEHLCPSVADTLVYSLIEASDAVVFSAAIPGQGGQNHINEQYLSYWVSRFAKHDYRMNDCLRPTLWQNDNVDWWYRQNIVVFLREGTHTHLKAIDSAMIDVIHPICWARQLNNLDLITSGSAPFTQYLILLAKRVIGPQLTAFVRRLIRKP